jgi:hypothetical protein
VANEEARGNGKRKMKRGGRKTLLTKPLQRKIERLLAQGHTITTVCQAVAIGQRTYYQWCERNPQFSQATTCAIGKSKIVLVDKLRLSDDWRAAAFLLERRWPEEFGRSDARMLPKEPEPQGKINVAFLLPDLKGKSLAEVANFPVITTEEAQTRVRAGGRASEPQPAQNEEPDSHANPDEPGERCR